MQARENGFDRGVTRADDDLSPSQHDPGDGRETPDRNGDGGLEEDLDLTEDQRQAMMELGSMKLDLGGPGKTRNRPWGNWAV